MTEPNSEDKEEAIIGEDFSEPDTEAEDGAEEGEEEKIIADYGIIIFMNLEGSGVHIEPIEKNMNRVATIDDIVSIIGLAQSHMQGNVTAAKVVKLLEGGMRKKIVHPGIRGVRR